MTKPPHERLILALDVATTEDALDLVDRIGKPLAWVKVGPVLLWKAGPKLLEELAARGLQIFCDLKFHDIPNTVSKAVSSVCSIAPISLLTLHASGGRKMIAAAREAAEKMPNGLQPKLLAVTVLTSMEEEDLEEVGSRRSVAEQVVHLGELAISAGANGLVCSSYELSSLRKTIGTNALLVVPGIRAKGSKDDQARTATAAEAISGGASMLVVGRPILSAANPRQVLVDLLTEIEGV